MIPRNEHPNPNFYRENYINLNGEWDFEFDFGNSGLDRELYKTDVNFSKKITVQGFYQRSLVQKESNRYKGTVERQGFHHFRRR